MALANQEAQRLNHAYVGAEHILLGIIKEGAGVGATALVNLGVDLEDLRHEVEKIVDAGPDMVTMGKLPQAPRAKMVIEYAIEEGRALNHNYAGTEHLLLGVLRLADGTGARALANLGVSLEGVRAAVVDLLHSGAATPSDTTSPIAGAAPQLQVTRSVMFAVSTIMTSDDPESPPRTTADLLATLVDATPDSLAGRILDEAGLTGESILEAAKRLAAERPEQ